MSEASSSVKCLQYIKSLQKNVEDLKVEKNNALKSVEQVRLQLSLLQKQYNDLQAKDTVPSTSQSMLQGHAPTSENAAMASLTTENLRLRKELTSHTNFAHTQSIVNASNTEHVVNQYRRKLREKNEQIALLEQQNCETDLTNRVCKLQQLLTKAMSVNHSYAQEILSLEEQLNSLMSKKNEEVQVETVSGDQDLNNSANASANDEEINELKADIERLNDRLQEEISKREEFESKCATLATINEQLEEENEILCQKNKLLSVATASDFPMESQLKTFVDDYNEERCQKEKQLKENQEIKGENNRLKQKVVDLTALLERNQRPFRERAPSSPPIMQQHPAFHQQLSAYDDPYRGNTMRPAYTHGYSDPNGGQPLNQQGGYTMPASQTGMQRYSRKIGYSISQPVGPGPRPISPPDTQVSTHQPFSFQPMAPTNRSYHTQASQNSVFLPGQPHQGNFVQADQAPPNVRSGRSQSSMSSSEGSHEMEKSQFSID